MLAMNKFVILVAEDLFNATNKPKELPNSAMMKIAAYADAMPILKSDGSGIPNCGRMELVGWVTFVPEKKKMTLRLFSSLLRKFSSQVFCLRWWWWWWWWCNWGQGWCSGEGNCFSISNPSPGVVCGLSLLLVL